VGRGEDDQDRQVLLDVVETVLDLAGDKDSCPALDWIVAIADLDLRLT
jgi:hypothetical protein